jgi:uncharacterized integral membrane protein
MGETLEQHIGWIIVLVAILALWILGLLTYIIYFKIRKIKDLMELDEKHEEHNSNGQLIVKGRTRNVWDYNFFPGLSKLWHFSGWQVLVAMVILLVLLLVYCFTKDSTLLNLLGVNFGIILGMMIQKTK